MTGFSRIGVACVLPVLLNLARHSTTGTGNIRCSRMRPPAQLADHTLIRRIQRLTPRRQQQRQRQRWNGVSYVEVTEHRWEHRYAP